jgi:cell division protein FtsZ
MAATAHQLEEPEQSDAPFMAPQAAQPDRRQQPLDAPAESDDQKGGKFRFRGKAGPGLFERITGTGRARREDEFAEHEAADHDHDHHHPAPDPRDRQPQLGGLDAEPPAPQPRQSEDDMLDIPAFLRRQAN